MPVYPGSRYEGIGRSALVESNGQVDAILHTRKRLTSTDLGEANFVQELEVGDELDLLASDFGGKSRLWWVIADLNEVVDPFSIPVGTKLVIPSEAEFAKR